MGQLIITFIIVVAAVGYAVYLLVKKFSKKPQADKPEDCNTCSSDCTGCPMANKTFEIDKP
jgi:hypothetical protein